MSDAAPARIRPATVEDAAGIAAVQVATWRTAFRGIVADETLERMSVEERTERWREVLSGDGRTCFVAESGLGESRRVAGFGDGGANRDPTPPYDAFTGELRAIYVLQSHQRGGTGTCLVRALVQWLLEAGHGSMIVWTLEASPFRAFYERLGGRRVGTREVTIDGAPYAGVAYGWDDLTKLRRRLEEPGIVLDSSV
ncbi:MAG: GNAT family N-acetyltransferase [Longimicrobiaceae bacterium]